MTRLLFACPFTAKCESLASGQHLQDFVYEGRWLHVQTLLCWPHPVGTGFSQPLGPGDRVLAESVRWWVRREPAPSAFSGLVVSPHVCPHCLFLV